MQFHYNYVMRFMKKYDLIFSSKQSNQVYMDVRSINYGFKKSGLSLFQPELAIEVELTRGELILNFCERLDKFASSDSEVDEWYLILKTNVLVLYNPNKILFIFSKFREI